MWRCLIGVVFWCIAGLAMGRAASMRSVTHTPTITGDAYADGDQIGAVQTLTGILSQGGGGLELLTLNLVDKAKVKHDLQLLFFSRLPVLASADNAPIDITDAEMASAYIGTVAIAEADYTTVMSGSTSVTKSLDMILRAEGGKNLYYVIVCKDSGGCDYGATTDLVMRLAFYE